MIVQSARALLDLRSKASGQSLTEYLVFIAFMALVFGLLLSGHTETMPIKRFSTPVPGLHSLVQDSNHTTR